MSTADDSYEPSSSGVETQSVVQVDVNDDHLYKFLVLDSGPIVRLTGLSALKNRAKSYYAVPAVLQEIRDAKARQHLKQLPFDLQTREATPQGIKHMADFARQTGDYNSLSAVDLQVLGLLYDLEVEASGGNMDHVRKTPKRTLGVGRIEALNKGGESKEKRQEEESSSNPQESLKDGAAFFQPPVASAGNDAIDDKVEPKDKQGEKSVVSSSSKPKTWAALVNPVEGSYEAPTVTTSTHVVDVEADLVNALAPMNLSNSSKTTSSSSSAPRTAFVKGQFSDAEEDDEDDTNSEKDDDSEDGEYANGDKEVSDEECDVYILDPDEVNESTNECTDEDFISPTDFPSLAQAMQVPYEASDEDEDSSLPPDKSRAVLAREHAENKRIQALKPVTKSGKMYNSFRKYGDIVKPKGIKKKESFEDAYYTSGVETVTPDITTDDDYDSAAPTSSRIMGGMTMSGQAAQVEDDGEGWITCKSDITKLKSDGALDIMSSSRRSNISSEPKGPPISQRAACATTDFAMQNVILQMNLELLSVDGIKVRRLKSWVTRCGACYTVYADNSDPTVGNLKRLFCARCGSDMMQRVAASVDSKTGRLRLHLSKKYKNNLRGTKYSLPKAGTNNRFQGDLLLREDQLMMGAWNQKVKKRSGGKTRSSAQSMFGSDIASNVGCHADLVKRDDIKVGFGRRNPNAAKGRERRGKKKKSSDKACGLRRY